MLTKNKSKRMPPQNQNVAEGKITVLVLIISLITNGLCQTTNGNNTNTITTLLPFPLFLLLIFVIIFSIIRKRKKENQVLIQQEKKTSFSRIVFGSVLILIGIFSISSSTKNFSSNLAVFLSTIFTSLVFITGGIRIFIISKPTVDDDRTIYADFGKRFWANAIDGIILLTVFYLAHLIFDKLSFFSYITVSLTISILSYVFIVWFVFKYFATPGKMIIGLTIKTSNKQNIGLKEAFLRSSIDILFALLFGLAFIMSLKYFSYSEFKELSIFKRMIYSNSHFPSWHAYTSALSQLWFWSELIVLMFNKRRRAIHDFIAGTIVVEKQ